MKLIYKADNIAEAHIIAGMLKSQGIDAHVAGHYLQGGIGELMAMGFANIHVNDVDVDKAKSIIQSYESKQKKSESGAAPKSHRASWPYWILLGILMLTMFFLYLR